MTDTGDQTTGLANLSPAEPGNVRAVKHGAHSERLIGPIASDIAREVETLCAGIPAGEAQFVAARRASPQTGPTADSLIGCACRHIPPTPDVHPGSGELQTWRIHSDPEQCLLNGP